MAEDVPLDVALSSVLAAAIDHSDRQALLMALHRQSSTESAKAPEEPTANSDEPAPSPEPQGRAPRLAAVPAPRPEPAPHPEPEPTPDGEAWGGAVVLAFTPRREWEPEDPPPAA
jgi:hypothetical protein